MVVCARLVMQVCNRPLGPTIFARKQRLATQHLCKDTTDTPDVNRLGVLLERKHDLRSSVPSCCHIFCHEARVVIGGCRRTSETKVADFQIAVSVQEEVGWLQISVEDVCRVHRFQGAESLIDEVLAVVVGEVLSSDDSVHISLHELLYKVSPLT
jgi:hypothetical protein